MDKFFWFIMFFFRKVSNRILNCIVSVVYGKRIRFDWRSMRIINPHNIVFGDNFYAGQGSWLQPINDDSKILFGDDVQISDWTHIAALGNIVIADGCLIGSRVHITDHSHGDTSRLEQEFSVMPKDRPLIKKGDIYIEENVWIGDGAVILGNVRIGRGAIVAANAVVTKDVPAFSIVGGVPAERLNIDC